MSKPHVVPKPRVSGRFATTARTILAVLLFLPLVALAPSAEAIDADGVTTTNTSNTTCGASASGRYTATLGNRYQMVLAIGGGGTQARGYVYSPSTTQTYTMWTVDNTGVLTDYGYNAVLVRHVNITGSDFLVQVRFTLNDVFGSSYTHVTVGCNAVTSTNVASFGTGGTINGYSVAGPAGKLWSYTRTAVTGDIGYLYTTEPTTNQEIVAQAVSYTTPSAGFPTCNVGNLNTTLAPGSYVWKMGAYFPTVGGAVVVGLTDSAGSDSLVDSVGVSTPTGAVSSMETLSYSWDGATLIASARFTLDTTTTFRPYCPGYTNARPLRDWTVPGYTPPQPVSMPFYAGTLWKDGYNLGYVWRSVDNDPDLYFHNRPSFGSHINAKTECVTQTSLCVEDGSTTTGISYRDDNQITGDRQGCTATPNRNTWIQLNATDLAASDITGGTYFNITWRQDFPTGSGPDTCVGLFAVNSTGVKTYLGTDTATAFGQTRTFNVSMDPSGQYAAFRVYVGDPSSGSGGFVGITLMEAHSDLGAGPPAPSAPLNLVASGGTQVVNLSWDAPSVGEVVNYHLYRKVTGGFDPFAPLVTLSNASTTYQDFAAVVGVDYTYTATASNAQGESATSNEANATATAPIRATRPVFGTNGSVYAGDRDATAQLMGIPGEALAFLFGITIILGVGFVGYQLVPQEYAAMGSVAGLVGGLFLALAFDFVPAWAVMLVLVVGVGGFVLLRRREA